MQTDCGEQWDRESRYLGAERRNSLTEPEKTERTVQCKRHRPAGASLFLEAFHF